jgi:hypothetical protein
VTVAGKLCRSGLGGESGECEGGRERENGEGKRRISQKEKEN